MRNSLPDMRNARLWGIGQRPIVVWDGRGTGCDPAAIRYSEAKLHGNSARSNADESVLGRAGLWANRDPTGQVKSLGKSDGLQLRRAGGVNGGELVFSSRTRGATSARVLCAGESGDTDACTL